MKLCFDRQAITSIDEALRFYKNSECESPTRSTIPLLSLLKHGGEIWKEVFQHFDLPDSSVEAHIEFTVSPPKGSGTASHTDIMLIDGDRAVAIEAKWTEPRYDDVGRWVMKGDNCQNRIEVTRGWLSLLGLPETSRGWHMYW